MDLKGRTELFTVEDCIPESRYNKDFTGEFVVISPSRLDGFHEAYRTPENQIFYALGGFGCSPITTGTAVIGRFVNDGEQCRMERYDFAGVLKPELVESLGLEVPKDGE